MGKKDVEGVFVVAKDNKVTFRNFANMYAFALWQAGHPDFQRSDGRSGAVKPVAETKN